MAQRNKADADTVARRIQNENARLDRELDALLKAAGLARPALLRLGKLGEGLPRQLVATIEGALDDERATLPNETRLSPEALGRPEHRTLLTRGCRLLRA